MTLRRLIQSNKTIISNFSYMSVLQVFILLTPLFTYPYLTRVLGTELYGLVITAQVLASYATIVVKFGFDSVSARQISIHREDPYKLSEIMASILSIRFFLWIAVMMVYVIIVLIVPIYRENFWLFLFSFGLTFNVLLFPQFFFQGIERMKFITFINVGIQVIIIVLIFTVIKCPDDYIYVPLLYTIGYLLGGITSLYIVFITHNLNFYIPTFKQTKYYFKDAFPLFATDAVCTVKDKLNYLLIGSFVNMSDVVVYDLGSKLVSLAVQPLIIINTVIFPKMAKTPSNKVFDRMGLLIFTLILVLVLVINVFLKPIVNIFIDEEVPLMPIRVFLLSPLFLGIASYIGYSFIIARGYNKYMFHSILITVSSYLIMLLTMYLLGVLNSILSFIVLAVISYLIEMIYRIFIMFKLRTFRQKM